MKKHWQLLLIGLLTLGMTALGISIAFANNIEEPPHDGELLAIATVGACNLIWVIPWTIVQRRRGDRRMLIAGVVLFAVCWSHFLFRYFHHPGFDPATWKTAINWNHSIAGLFPAHEAGYMVPDIISSEVCVGKTKMEVKALLGPYYFPQRELGGCSSDTCIGYFYSGQVLFDGCDKLMLCFKNDICTHVGYCGCD